MALFASSAGIKLTHVPYKGASQAALGVAAGEVPVAFQGLATVTGLARGGKLRLIGVTTNAAAAAIPGRADGLDLGLAGLHVQLVVHDHGARRDAEGDRRDASTRRS